jgi:hypothetical protein
MAHSWVDAVWHLRALGRRILSIFPTRLAMVAAVWVEMDGVKTPLILCRGRCGCSDPEEHVRIGDAF